MGIVQLMSYRILELSSACEGDGDGDGDGDALLYIQALRPERPLLLLMQPVEQENLQGMDPLKPK